MAAIELRGGLIVSDAAIVLAVQLEARGHTLTVSADGKLLVSNGAALTADDKQQIPTLRLHLMAIAGYVAPA